MAAITKAFVISPISSPHPILLLPPRFASRPECNARRSGFHSETQFPSQQRNGTSRMLCSRSGPNRENFDHGFLLASQRQPCFRDGECEIAISRFAPSGCRQAFRRVHPVASRILHGQFPVAPYPESGLRPMMLAV
jgi:hypothetical protein